MNERMEHEHELENVRETLANVEVNNKKLFVGIEQGIGKNENNVLVVMHRGMMSYGKEWTRQNYGTKFVLIEDKEHESSVTLNREETP